jgi:hypothetical protein
MASTFNGRMRSKTLTALTALLVLHRTRISKNAMKKFNTSGQWRNKLFLIVIYCFLFVKAAMIAPRVCKLRKTGIDQCAMVLSTRYK